jgi:hypothetical protein
MGSALALTPHLGSRVRVYNNTIAGQGDCLLEIECDRGPCDGTEDVQLRNNALRGSVDWRQPWENACFAWDPGYPPFPSFLSTGKNDHNIVSDVKDNEGFCALDASNLCDTDPLFVNAALAAFDGHLQSGSPARDSGLAVGSFGMVPGDDLEKKLRPFGTGVDRGAYEYGAGGGTGSTRFYTLAPCRLFDTRNAAGPLGGPSLSAGQSRIFTVTATCSVPTTAKTISANITVVSPAAPGYFRLYPGDGSPPASSSINFRPGQVRANNGLFPLATDGTGRLGVQNGSAGTADAVLDVNGYFE